MAERYMVRRILRHTVFVVIGLVTVGLIQQGWGQTLRVLPDSQGYGIYDSTGQQIGRVVAEGEGFSLYSNDGTQTAEIRKDNDNFIVWQIAIKKTINILKTENGYKGYDTEGNLIFEIIQDEYGGYTIFEK